MEIISRLIRLAVDILFFVLVFIVAACSISLVIAAGAI